jgi:hypothetical protein
VLSFSHTHCFPTKTSVGPCENLNQRQERIGIGNGKKERERGKGRDPFVKFTFDWHQK